MEGLANMATVVGDRFTTNIQSTFQNMSPQKWLRVVIIAGAYMLLRPYLLKLGGKLQMNTHEKEAEEAEEAARAKAKISPNQLRGRVEIPEDTDDEEDEEEEGEATGADWGKKARRRQRQMIKKLLEAEERRLMETKEMEEDKDIEEFLID
ncbi:protein trafficking Pga2 [Cladorrhinum sp. PSN332]|nr:protein trafficking Pga2 [Cladorrhinum sp. PSN332]